uniref:Uncharacterized protein n=1 Tax=Moniliophthora roreri TaxID=221103 RepID=A0A0W0FUX9_MONRR
MPLVVIAVVRWIKARTQQLGYLVHRLSVHDDVQKEIKKDIDDLNKEFEVCCAALAKKWKRKERYVKDMFFQGGVHAVWRQKKINLYNAWKFVKAQDLRESGIVGIQVAKRYHKEYQHLKRPENWALLRQIIYKYKKYAKQLVYQRIKLPTARGHAQDFANTASQMTKMKDSSSLFTITPKALWHPNGTSLIWALNHTSYLKVILRGWDTDAIGFKLEAFAIAGCRPENMASNSDNKLKVLKYRVHEMTRQRLSDALGPFQNPSHMSNKGSALQYLADGLDKGTIGFKHLDPDELEQWKEEYVEKMRNLEEAEGREGDAEKSTGKKAKGTKRTSATKKTPAAASKSAQKKAPPAKRLAPPTSSSSSTSSSNSDSSESEREPQAKLRSKPKQVLKRKKPANEEEDTPGPDTTNNVPDTSCGTPPTGSPLFLPEDNPQSPTRQLSPSHDPPDANYHAVEPDVDNNSSDDQTLRNGMSRQKRVKRVRIASEVDRSKKHHVELDRQDVVEKVPKGKGKGKGKSGSH